MNKKQLKKTIRRILREVSDAGSGAGIYEVEILVDGSTWDTDVIKASSFNDLARKIAKLERRYEDGFITMMDTDPDMNPVEWMTSIRVRKIKQADHDLSPHEVNTKLDVLIDHMMDYG